jgi:starch-binding outer membrane protein, SusD/RagB family
VERYGGVTRRAYLKPRDLTNGSDSLTQVENMLVDEAALELAYEGQRWSDLLRIAIRRNDPSFIANKVYDKLNKSGDAAGAADAARAKLGRGEYYLPFKW